MPQDLVASCPDCSKTGAYDSRVTIGGRGIYRCPDGHIWQDAREAPSTKGTIIKMAGAL